MYVGGGGETISCAIGFRVQPKQIDYVIVSGTADALEIDVHDKLRAPRAFELPDVLTHYRETCLNLINEYDIEACGIKTTEPLAGRKGASPSPDRLYAEGVMLEACRSSGLKVVYGPYSVVSSFLGTSGAKKYVGKESFRSVEGWDALKDLEQEAALIAIAALSLLKS